jgi:hypothetical protein
VTIYSVFERPDELAPAVVPEKFSWFAALLPPVYALVHGLWLGLLAYVVALVALGFVRLWIGGEAVAWLYLLFAVLIGFEAAGFRRGKLLARGWTYGGDVVAGAEDLAMRDWLVRKPLEVSAA